MSVFDLKTKEKSPDISTEASEEGDEKFSLEFTFQADKHVVILVLHKQGVPYFNTGHQSRIVAINLNRNSDVRCTHQNFR